MSQVRLKVCGITSLEDALGAIECGADYLGFNFYRKSPRYISPSEARTIVDATADRTTAVGVFVNEENAKTVKSLMSESGVAMAQLHGNEGDSYCAEVGADRVIKVVRPSPDFEAASIVGYPAAAFLIDATDDKLYGGTGRTSNWEIAREIARLRPLFLAGGIGPNNVREAIARVAPFAVDVNSAVETAPGRKDLEKLRQLRLEMEK